MNYKLLDKQREFIEIPHAHPLDVAIYQGGTEAERLGAERF